MKSKKINADLLERIKVLDSQLSDDGRPEELRGLPPGHPLLLQFEKSKELFDSRQQQENEMRGRIQVRQIKAKQKSETDNSNRSKKATEDKANLINKEIVKMQRQIEMFSKIIDGSRKDFADYPFAKVKMARLYRLMAAVHRGLEDSHVSTTRFERV